MGPAEVVGIGICVATIAGLLGYGAALLRARRSFGRLAERLRCRVLASNERLTLEGPSFFGSTGELVDAINGALDAERALRMDDAQERRRLQEDLASLAHDIRTPLAGARGYLELYAFDQGAQNRDRYVAAAHERLVVMGDLVDNLFAYARLADAPEGESIERVVVLSALAEALAAQYPALVGRGWQPVVDFEDEELWVRANRTHLVRVFSNLVTNALRYGTTPPSIVQRGTLVVFSNCVAQPEAIDVERLFERNYRGNTASGVPGSGLGLAIVARLCEGMGMMVTARVEGNTLTFEMRLPD